MTLTKTLSCLFALTSLFLSACDKPRQVPPESSATGTSDTTSSKAPLRVEVNDQGYQPNSVKAEPGKPVTLEFERTSEVGCGQEIVFPDHNIRRSLPLNQKVAVTVTPRSGESIAFTCGMGMYRGSIVATH